MLPDRVSNPGPLTYKSAALPIALRGPAAECNIIPFMVRKIFHSTQSQTYRGCLFKLRKSNYSMNMKIRLPYILITHELTILLFNQEYGYISMFVCHFYKGKQLL